MEGMLGALDILFSGGAYWLGCVCPPGSALLFVRRSLRTIIEDLIKKDS